MLLSLMLVLVSLGVIKWLHLARYDGFALARDGAFRFAIIDASSSRPVDLNTDPTFLQRLFLCEGKYRSPAGERQKMTEVVLTKSSAPVPSARFTATLPLLCACLG
ncbi:hypothetical protein OH492_10075 [Vibrio chagasii]|nr:hypothetical protein [Vibrio chagasii]